MNQIIPPSTLEQPAVSICCLLDVNPDEHMDVYREAVRLIEKFGWENVNKSANGYRMHCFRVYRSMQSPDQWIGRYAYWLAQYAVEDKIQDEYFKQPVAKERHINPMTGDYTP